MTSESPTKRSHTGKIILAATILVLGALGYLYWKSILTRSIETLIGAITGTEVRLQAANLDFASKTGSLRGLTVGNPKGYQTESAFKVKEIRLVLGDSNEEGVYHINEILIQAPEVTYELGEGGSNFDVIQKNVNTFANTGGESSPAPKPDKKEISSDTLLIVDHFYIKEGQARLAATAAGDEAAASPLPEIHLKNIGKRQGGATPGEVAQTVVNALKVALIKKALAQDLNSLRDTAEKALQNTSEVVGDTLQKGAESLTEGLNNVFGK